MESEEMNLQLSKKQTPSLQKNWIPWFANPLLLMRRWIDLEEKHWIEWKSSLFCCCCFFFSFLNFLRGKEKKKEVCRKGNLLSVCVRVCKIPGSSLFHCKVHLKEEQWHQWPARARNRDICSKFLVFPSLHCLRFAAECWVLIGSFSYDYQNHH